MTVTIWNPRTKLLMERVEKIQRRATNFIINNPHRLKPGYKNYKTRLKELNMLPTSYRREIIDISMLIKSLNNDNGFDIHEYLKFTQPGIGCQTRTQVHGTHINIPKYNYVSTSNQYVIRASRTWNALPTDIRVKIRNYTDSDQIKKVLVPFFNNLRDNYFDPDATCTWVLSCYCARCRP